MYAGWGGAAIDREMQPYYGSFYGDPLTSIRTIISLAARANFSDASAPRFTSEPKPCLNWRQLAWIQQGIRNAVRPLPNNGPEFLAGPNH